MIRFLFQDHLRTLEIIKKHEVPYFLARNWSVLFWLLAGAQNCTVLNDLPQNLSPIFLNKQRIFVEWLYDVNLALNLKTIW